MTETAIPDDIRNAAREAALRLDDIHFNSRHGQWIDGAAEVVEQALMAERARLAPALVRASYEMALDYVDDVWPRDLEYLAQALGLSNGDAFRHAKMKTTDFEGFKTVLCSQEKTVPE